MKIKDPVHGYIELDEGEGDLIDLPELQRLRRIKQLGFSSLVYPGATHTRFSHTLGVLKVVDDYADSLDLDEERRKELRVAALFHDTGHGPWSHLAERALDFDHEDVSCEIAEMNEDNYSVDSDRVRKLIRGELEIGRVLHGDVDADRLDYLQRDARNAGIEHGMIDTGTIIENATIDSRRLVYEHKAIQALESLLVAREHMIRSVYRHHAALIADKMVVEAIEQENLKQRPEEWFRADDYKMSEMLGDNELFKRVRNRNLYKRVKKTDAVNGKLRSLLAEESGLERSEILTRTVEPDPGENPKRDGSNLDVRVKHYGEIKDIEEVSVLARSLQKSKIEESGTWIYAPEDKVEKVKQACEKVNI